MARLKVFFKGKVISEVQLDSQRSYIAGRKEDCDIHLQPEKGVSREHFKIHFDGNSWVVELLSRYGNMLVEGEKADKLNLSNGKSFDVSTYHFEYYESSVTGNTGFVATLDQSNENKSLVKKSENDGDKTYVGVLSFKPVLKVIGVFGEVKEEITLDSGDTWIAGRELTCHIVIKDQRVSRRQFEIKKSDSKFHILDLGSVNGTKLNGNFISASEPTVLASGDQIVVLDNILVFELRDPNFQVVVQNIDVPQPSVLVQIEQNPYPQVNQMNYQNIEGSLPPDIDKPKFDLYDFITDKSNRIKVIIGILLMFGIIMSLSDDGGQIEVKKDTPIDSKNAEFNKLTPQQQASVRQAHRLAKNFFMQQKFELAKSELSKIYEFVPEYEDSKEIERLADEALAILQKQKEEEQRVQEKNRIEEIVLLKLADCKKIITKDVTMEQMDSCIQSIIQYNPEDPRIAALKSEVQNILDEKEAKEEERADYQRRVGILGGLYQKALKLKNEKQLLKSIDAFEKVVNSSLPDPGGLKGKSREQINLIKKDIAAQIAQYLDDADKYYSNMDLKSAVLELRKAKQIDPKNYELIDKIEKYSLELRKQMAALYQEGILEESFGNIQNSDGRMGAIDKWKKIIQLDLKDGEYYRKAFIKLQKYRAL